MEAAAPDTEQLIEPEFGSADATGFDETGGILHFVLDRVAQQLRGGDDAGRDEGEQKRIFNRGNAALVVPKPRKILF